MHMSWVIGSEAIELTRRVWQILPAPGSYSILFVPPSPASPFLYVFIMYLYVFFMCSVLKTFSLLRQWQFLPVYYYIISLLLLIRGDPGCHGNWGTRVDVVEIKGLCSKRNIIAILLCLICTL